MRPTINSIMEFLVTLAITVPPGTDDSEIEQRKADDLTVLRGLLESLPLWPWITEHTEPLGAHPNDPALIKGGR
jgi:muconolactone delta-isomerase